MIRCSSDPLRPRELSWAEFVFPVKSHLLSLPTLLLLRQKRSERGKPVPLLTAVFLNYLSSPVVRNSKFVHVAYKQRYVVCFVIYANSWSRIILVHNEINPNRTSEMMPALCSIKYTIQSCKQVADPINFKSDSELAFVYETLSSSSDP